MKSFLIIIALFLLTYIPLNYFATGQLKKALGPGLVVFVILGTLSGIYLPDMMTYFIAIALLLMCTVRGRVDAVCRYLLLAAFVPQLLWRIGGAGHYFGAIDSAGVLAVAAYIASRFDPRPGARAGRGWVVEDFLVLTLFLIMAIGVEGFDKFTDVLRTWQQQFLVIAMPYVLFRSTVKSVADYRAAIACFGAASLFLAIFAIYEARLSTDIFDIITHHLSGVYIPRTDTRGGMLRASATMGGPLALACFMTVGIFAVACSRDFFRNALGYYGCLAVAFLGLLASQSRGSLVALLASAVVLCLAMRKWGIAAAAAIVAGLAWPTLKAVGTVVPAVASFINGGEAPHHGPYYDYRSLLLQRGLEVASNHPWTGMRMTQVIDALADITQGEGIVDLVNVYLVFLLISGIVGFVPFISLTVTSGVRGALGFKQVTDPAMLRARGFTLAAFSVTLFQFSFVSFIDRTPMLFVFSLFGIRLLAQARQTVGQLSAAAPGAPQPYRSIGQWVHGAEGNGDPVVGPDKNWQPKLPSNTPWLA